MITVEQIKEAFGDNRKAYKNKEDHTFKALSTLRTKIPYSDCKEIITAAEHDVIYLCNIDLVTKYLDIEDLEILADCNVCFDWSLDCLFLYI